MLAARTTLGVGGPVRHLASCASPDAVEAALSWANERGLPVAVLGGGSNLLVADSGFGGLMLAVTDDALTVERHLDHAIVRAGGGVEWDALVASAVDAGLAGLEGLSGIPGRVGAAPIQNVGAYGQEVAETIVGVRVVERATGAVLDLAADACGFGYRWSRFKGDWRDRYVIVRVDFRLPHSVDGTVRYPDLLRRLGLDEDEDATATLPTIRHAVLEVRRSKSMVLDPDDPNRRSAGSFFTNPIVAPAVAAAVAEQVRRRNGRRPMPRYPAGPDDPRVKLSAAWLIEEAGFSRGWGNGPAGLSTRHTLAIVNRGGATAADILRVASTIRRGVRDTFGVILEPEPTFLGFDRPAAEILDRPSDAHS
ncbi:MAG: UDP-N-acetylmuramate dehydrogenase [Acidobacteriota bacterium]